MAPKMATDAALFLTIEGPLVGVGRLPLVDVADIAMGLQQALTQIASVIQFGSSREAGSPRPEVEVPTRLELVGIKTASAGLVLDFPPDTPRSFPGLDIGTLAIERLIHGVDSLHNGSGTPDDWDDGVFRAVRLMGKSLDRGHVTSVELASRTSSKSRYTATSHDRVKARLSLPSPLTFVTVVGRLMMVDFNTDKRRCRIEPPKDSPIDCTYPLDLQNTLLESVKRFVSAEGYAEHRTDGSIRQLSILRLSPLKTPAGAEAEVRPRAISQLLSEQGVGSFGTAEALVDESLWEDDEEVQRFLAWVSDQRETTAW